MGSWCSQSNTSAESYLILICFHCLRIVEKGSWIGSLLLFDQICLRHPSFWWPWLRFFQINFRLVDPAKELSCPCSTKHDVEHCSEFAIPFISCVYHEIYFLEDNAMRRANYVQSLLKNLTMSRLILPAWSTFFSCARHHVRRAST
jgi:hypothetical protein